MKTGSCPNLLHRGLITTLCLVFSVPVYAAVYKWVDEDGQVHYGDQPQVLDAEIMTIRTNETTKPREIKTDEEQAEAGDEGSKQPEKQPAEPEKPKISAAEKSRLCNEAKGDLQKILSRGRMRSIDKDGNYTVLSEEQRQQRINAAKEKQRKYCR
jgi:hypothetical protein